MAPACYAASLWSSSRATDGILKQRDESQPTRLNVCYERPQAATPANTASGEKSTSAGSIVNSGPLVALVSRCFNPSGRRESMRRSLRFNTGRAVEGNTPVCMLARIARRPSAFERLRTDEEIE